MRENFGVTDAEPAAIAGGAACYRPDVAWIYAADDSSRALGRSLALAAQRGIVDVHLVVDRDGGPLARRAAALDPPAHVWRAEGTALVPVEAEPLVEARGAPAGSAPLVALLRAAGAEVVVEHGVVFGEIRGLEVARIEPAVDGSLRLAVGVGRFDQEATEVMHGHLPTEEALAHAISEVRTHRHRHARPHPVNRLARERWLRAQLVADPEPVGLQVLAAVAPPSPRRNVRDPQPAAALGRDDRGARVLVVCSVGIDLELVPLTADLVLRERPERVVLAMPRRDDVPVQRTLAARLPVPTSFVHTEGDWPS